MKTIKVISAFAIAAIMISSCGDKKQAKTEAGAGAPVITQAEIDSVSYAVGTTLGFMVKEANFGDIDYSKVYSAMKDVIGGKKDLKVDQQKAGMIIQNYLKKRSEVVASENLEKGKKFLETNKTKDSVKVTESGLQYIIRNEGSEPKLTDIDTVEVNYRGTLIDGTEFDTSYGKTPARFPVGGVIAGWKEGLKLVGKGGKLRLFIPAELGYGAQQAGPNIGPNSTLVFDVEVLNVVPGKAVPTQPEVKK